MRQRKCHPLIIQLLFIQVCVYGQEEIMSTAYLSEVDSAACCYTLSFDYDPADGPFDGIEVSLISLHAQFSAISFDLSGGWVHSIPEPQRRLRWWRAGGNLPTGDYALFDFCIDEWFSNQPIRMAVNWLNNNTISATDTLELVCQNCSAIWPDSTTCLPDSSYFYAFNYTNNSDFTVNRLRIRENPGEDLVVEDEIVFAPPLLPGATAGGLSIQLRPDAAALSSLCLEFTASRLLDGDIALDCCTVTHCIDIPVCDRCCTEYADFEADVAQRFTYKLDCTGQSATFTAEALSECDEVFWRIRMLSGGPTVGSFLPGDEPFIYNCPMEGNYRVCMRVTRYDLDGNLCYDADLATLEVCDTILIDCPVTGVATVAAISQIALWPNPARDWVELQFSEQVTNLFYTVYTSGGILIDRQWIKTSSRIRLDIRQWPAGVYFILIQPYDAQIEVLRLLVLR
jgi:hypothetical protein